MYEEEKNEILKTAQKLIECDLVKLSAGNLSIRSDEHVIVTPSGRDYSGMNASDLMVIDLAGNIVEGKHMPSLDSVGLLYIYNHRPDIFAIIHTHQVFATALSLTEDKLPAILTTLANAVGGEVKVTPFAPAGRVETGIVTVENLGNKRAVILKQHGVMTVGPSLKDALYAAVYLEEAAKSYFLSKLFGKAAVLDEDQIEEAVNIFKGYAK